MRPLKSNIINMQKSVFLPLWDNYELYGRKILHIESFSVIESENLVIVRPSPKNKVVFQ